MQNNPIIDLQIKRENDEKEIKNFRYPFRIVCVYYDEENKNENSLIIKIVKDFCKANNVSFSAREYDTYKFKNDAELAKLPAFNLMNRDYPEETYYYDEKPIIRIIDKINEYHLNIKLKEYKEKLRQERIQNLKNIIKNIFKLRN